MVNFYNPCNELTLDELNIIRTKAGENLIWCGDFNAHNSLWGSLCTDWNEGLYNPNSGNAGMFFKFE